MFRDRTSAAHPTTSKAARYGEGEGEPAAPRCATARTRAREKPAARPPSDWLRLLQLGGPMDNPRSRRAAWRRVRADRRVSRARRGRAVRSMGVARDGRAAALWRAAGERWEGFTGQNGEADGDCYRFRRSALWVTADIGCADWADSTRAARVRWSTSDPTPVAPASWGLAGASGYPWVTLESSDRVIMPTKCLKLLVPRGGIEPPTP